jgi:hypothetical protein
MPESGVRTRLTLIDVAVRLVGPVMLEAVTAAAAVIGAKMATTRAVAMIVSTIVSAEHTRDPRAVPRARPIACEGVG